jgi:hypothetical protein
MNPMQCRALIDPIKLPRWKDEDANMKKPSPHIPSQQEKDAMIKSIEQKNLRDLTQNPY